MLRDGKLYGRGGADDGYATFGSLTAIRALREQGIPHARCVVLIEGCEESRQFRFAYLHRQLADRIGSPDLVVCLDAECGNYEQLWCTTSLRGNLTGTLRVDVLTRRRALGHRERHRAVELPGAAQLLARVEDETSGRILPDALYVDIPEERRERRRAQPPTHSASSVLSEVPWIVDEPALSRIAATNSCSTTPGARRSA